MNDTSLIYLAIFLLIPLTGMAFLIVSKKTLFPYVFLSVFAMEYLSPKGFGSIFTIGKIIPLLFLFAYLFVIKNKIRLHYSQLFNVLLIFALYFFSSLIWSPDAYQGLSRGFTTILLVILFWFVAHFNKEEIGLRHFLGAFILISLLFSITAIYNFLLYRGAYSFIRTGAFNLHSIHTSFLITLGTIPLIVSSLFNNRKNWNWIKPAWYPVLIIINIIGILTTASKTAIVLLIVVFMFLLVFHSNSIQNLRRKLIVGGFIIVSLLFAINPYIAIFDNINSRYDSIDRKYSSNNIVEKYMPARLLIATYAWEDIKSKPLFGVGLEGFKHNLIVSKYKSFNTSTHNSFLWAFTEGGVVGLLLLLLVFIMTIKAARKSIKVSIFLKDKSLEESSITILLMVSVSLLSSLSFNMEFNKFFWILLAMVDAQYGICKNKLVLKGRHTLVVTSNDE